MTNIWSTSRSSAKQFALRADAFLFLRTQFKAQRAVYAEPAARVRFVVVRVGTRKEQKQYRKAKNAIKRRTETIPAASPYGNGRFHGGKVRRRIPSYSVDEARSVPAPGL